MLKKSLILIAITCIFIVTGCNNAKQDIGGFFGELACLNAEENGQISLDDVATIAQSHGFENSTSVQDLIQTLTPEQRQKEVNQAVEYVASNCQSNFDNAGIDAEPFLTEFLDNY